MNWGKMVVMGVFQILGLLLHEADAQKRWDGEAGDGLWNSETNWSPNGVPDSSDLLLFDNFIIPTPYTVTLPPGANQTKLCAMSIQPSPGQSITLIIPETNTAVPAINLSSTQQSITICNGGNLINRSGAVAGNTIQMNGKIRIENGGRYSHQTLRGNAYIITKNEVGAGTELGTVEFDVPGVASYPISVSGKQYGSLRLISSTEEKRNYVGSGNNDLTIKGNLMVGERAQFNSTLNSNIYLNGNIDIYGTLSLSPAVSDTANREMIFIGDSSSYFSNGSLVLGAHFRNIRIQKGSLWLESAIHLNQVGSAFIVGSNTRVMLDTFCIVGEGLFRSDSAAVLGIASPDGISIDASKGNIRTAQQVFSPKTSFIFYGNQEQVSGTGYPLSVASLEINKARGNLRLTTSLKVCDSLRLSSGRVMSSISSTLHLTGIICADGINQYGWAGGNSNSFIDGPFRSRSTMQGEAYFPIGKNEVFAPLKIQFKNGTGGELEIEYHNNTIAINNKLMPPLKSINNKEYWDIKSTSPLDTTTTNESIILSLRPTHHYNTTNHPFIVRADSLMGEWSLLTNSAYDSISSTLASIILLEDGVYTIGSMQEEILTAQQINLSFRKDKHQAALEWNSQDNNMEKFLIEKSTDGVSFHTIEICKAEMNQAETKFVRKVNLNENENAYFRIVGSDAADRQLLSNIVFIRSQKNISSLYPNPASEELTMRMSDHTGRRDAMDIQVINNFGRSIPVSISFETKMMKINIAYLPNGLYRLIIIADGKKEVYPFIKSN